MGSMSQSISIELYFKAHKRETEHVRQHLKTMQPAGGVAK